MQSCSRTLHFIVVKLKFPREQQWRQPWPWETTTPKAPAPPTSHSHRSFASRWPRRARGADHISSHRLRSCKGESTGRPRAEKLRSPEFPASVRSRSAFSLEDLPFHVVSNLCCRKNRVLLHSQLWRARVGFTCLQRNYRSNCKLFHVMVDEKHMVSCNTDIRSCDTATVGHTHTETKCVRVTTGRELKRHAKRRSNLAGGQQGMRE